MSPAAAERVNEAIGSSFGVPKRLSVHRTPPRRQKDAANREPRGSRGGVFL
jgi:hypothetical protein